VDKLSPAPVERTRDREESRPQPVPRFGRRNKPQRRTPEVTTLPRHDQAEAKLDLEHQLDVMA